MKIMGSIPGSLRPQDPLSGPTPRIRFMSGMAGNPFGIGSLQSERAYWAR